MGEQLLSSHNTALELTEGGTLFQGARAAQSTAQLVPGYGSRKRRFLFFAVDSNTSLEEAEQKVLEEMGKHGGIIPDASAIIYMCDEKSLTPGVFLFNNKSTFLGLSWDDLIKKLTVVVTDAAAKQRLERGPAQGMHILDFTTPTLVLSQILAQAGKTEEERRNQIQETYEKAAQAVRRNAKQAVILVVGHTGHGKTKTINRLLGKNLFTLGRTPLGSATKIIQRARVTNTSAELAVEITVAFDDTPPLNDTTYEDREWNASLLSQYKREHFPEIYPNVILLVANWESVSPDAHNDPSHFTSAIGDTIYSLYTSDLVDEQRANIVVVVTKVLSSLHQFDDYKTEKEKSAQWRIEEGRRRGIITDIQRKMFPKSSPWEIVFIENGGSSRDMSSRYPVLPDGLLSHQNLYDAISNTIKRPSSDGSLDLVGIQALQVLTGAAPSDASVETMTLISSLSNVALQNFPVNTRNPIPPPQNGVIRHLATIHLGTTFDNARGLFGCTNVLESTEVIVKPGEGTTDFVPMTGGGSHAGLDHARLRTHYSSDWAFRAAVSAYKNLHCYILHCVSGQIAVQSPQLSRTMQQLVSRLPTPWSREEQSKYSQFFFNYGTHVITQVIMGGTIRIAVDSTSGKKQSIMVFRDGGAAVASDLTNFLERNFCPEIASSLWAEKYEKWRHALETEPVFCPDHESTRYIPIHELSGLTLQQKENLEKGYRYYMASKVKDDRAQASKGSRTLVLKREINMADAAKSHTDGMTQALYRAWQHR
ncbi:protein hedgehog [Favolaschia claudopus]|uniref:Protein hedgehog n=1 Tax=Favolaschia claudopus TaxID=2862362 RepID=A0AAW0CMV9_9AGAR